ncbi:hypothetical protein LMG26696_03530 [Achromobacter pulmonis]|uniref:DUF7940 domain-containing protein n=1 Tax=Achromobacter pulmonis TaxID=1389932 RepID=UPI001468DB57|nr:hypothetical protein [Achromobacter pulmonis]CAB3664137.1 hypothetical protein LMG26696_03530 [Achromobacter pulmonis]
MNLIDDWRRKFHRLWSVRLALIAAVLSAIEVAINWWLSGKPPLIVIGAGLFSLCAAVARVISQPRLNDEDRN